jgi:uncharacterized protein (TIGR02147 family)
MEVLKGEKAGGPTAKPSKRANTSRGEAPTSAPPPDVMNYLDFKTFLKDFYLFKKAQRKGFSFASFSQKANIASPNYLKRVMDGERPLNAESIPKFCVGLELNASQSIYFEALVNFNQSKDEDVKRHYFGILRKSSENFPGAAIEVLGDQFEVASNWYISPVYELINLADFREDPAYIAKKLKNKISKKQASFAIETLLRIGLLRREPNTGKLQRNYSMVRYSKDILNMAVRNFHHQMLQRVDASLKEDQFGTWNARALTLAVKEKEFQEVYEKLSAFTYELNKLYSTDDSQPDRRESKDVVIQVNCQLIQLSETSFRPILKNQKGSN